MLTGPPGEIFSGQGQGYCSNRPPLWWLRENGYIRKGFFSYLKGN